MKKHLKTTLINLPRENHARCPIYEHEGRFYIKANKPNTSAFCPFFYEGVEYAEVKSIMGEWFTV